MQNELAEHNESRTKELALLTQQQRHSLEQLEAEMTNLGVNLSDLTDSLQDIHFYAAQAAVQFTPTRSLTRSFPRSSSSSSFLSNTNHTPTYK